MNLTIGSTLPRNWKRSNLTLALAALGLVLATSSIVLGGRAVLKGDSTSPISTTPSIIAQPRVPVSESEYVYIVGSLADRAIFEMALSERATAGGYDTVLVAETPEDVQQYLQAYSEASQAAAFDAHVHVVDLTGTSPDISSVRAGDAAQLATMADAVSVLEQILVGPPIGRALETTAPQFANEADAVSVLEQILVGPPIGGAPETTAP